MSSQVYLPADRAGCPYCFDPDCEALRRALAGPQPSPEEQIEASHLAADIEWYHRLLQYHYAGYIDLLHVPGFEPTAFFGEWAQGLRRQGGVVRLRDALGEPLIRLAQVLPDGHRVFPAVAGVVAGDERVAFHEYQQAVEADSTRSIDPAGIAGARRATWRTAPMLRRNETVIRVATVSAIGGGDTRAAGDAFLLRRRTDPTRTLQAPLYEWHASGDTSVITLRRFGGRASASRELERFPAEYTSHASRGTILFDLRGNSGGSLRYTEQWIARAVGGTLRRRPLLDFAPCHCTEWNRAVEAEVRDGTVDLPRPRQERAHALTAIRSEPASRSAVTRLALRSPGAEAPAAPQYSGRVFALIDRGTGSSGELTAWELQRNLNAVLIGERSGGGMQYGQQGMFVLPATGLICRIPTRRFFYDHEVEGVGLPVDVYLQDIGMEVDAVVAAITRPGVMPSPF